MSLSSEHKSGATGQSERVAELEAQLHDLLEKLGLYEHLLDSTRDIVFVKDKQSRYVYTNKACRDLFGMKMDEIAGVISLPFNQPEHTDQYLKDDAYVFETGNTLVIAEEPFVRKDGVLRLFETIKSPIRDAQGNVALIVGLARDITDRTLLEEDRRRAERALDEAERLFRQMAESMRDVFWLATPNFSSFVYVSPAYESVWGRPCKELLQDPMSFWKVVLPQDRPEFQRKFDELIKSGNGNFSHEYRIVLNEHIRWLWTRTFPIRDPEGRLFRIGGITHDITERKEVERRVSEFNSMVSHELRTPLTSIRAALGLIEGGQTEPVGESTMDLVHIARVECDRMIRLINDLLDIKKIESEKLEMKLEKLKPVDIVEAVLSANRSFAAECHIGLKADVNAHEGFTGDRDRIIQVLTNLISNAIKFSPPDSEVVLSVGLGPDKNFVRFSVSDKGPGIPETEQSKLFTAFQQIDSSDSRAKGGTGLGLAISKAIVDRHGGSIGFDTNPGSGSTFWFELPIGDVTR